MEITHIASPANPRVKLAKALHTRKGRRQHAQLLLEGVRLIEDSISAGFPPALVLFDSAAQGEMLPLLTQAAAQGAALASLPAAIMAEVCETTSPQGIVAVSPWPQLAPGHTGLSVVVDGVRDPGNLGALLRSAAAAGVDQVIVWPGVTDPWAPKVLRAGMGAHFRLAIRAVGALDELDALLGSCQRLVATASATDLYTEVDWTQPSALIIGGESQGARATTHWAGLRPIAIPMAREVESLNAAMAASVILFEAVRQRRTGQNTKNAD